MTKKSKNNLDTAIQATPDDETLTSWETRLNNHIDDFNSKYAVVFYGGKTSVLKEFRHPETKKILREFMRFQDFQNLFCHKQIKVGEKQNEARTPIKKTYGEAWLENHNRRQYTDGIVFDPSTYVNGIERPTPIYGDKLNFWQGYSVEPKKGGTWTLLDKHIKDVICQCNVECVEYLYNWIARCLQYPNLNGQVALVLKGEKGAGKGVLGNFLVSLFDTHGLQINNSKHLTSNFNAHMADCCLLFADEVFFAGDKSHENILKGLVTEPTLFIERKGIDGETTPNRLKIIMSSNNDWVIPASSDERRYFVLEVSSQYLKQKSYFDPLRAELENPKTKAAFLWDMLHRDISNFDVHNVPETDALKHQRAQSLDSFGKFWIDVLERGYIYQSQHNSLELSQWTPEPAADLIRAGYWQWCDIHKIGQFGILTSEQIGKQLKKWGYENKQRRTPLIIGESNAGELLKSGCMARYYRVGSLDDAIKSFCEAEKIELSEILN